MLNLFESVTYAVSIWVSLRQILDSKGVTRKILEGKDSVDFWGLKCFRISEVVCKILHLLELGIFYLDVKERVLLINS